jgi:hypothetical protein
LQTNDHDRDADEKPVGEDALKHVNLVVDTAVVEDVEDLHPHKDVEDEGVELELLVGVREVVAENVSTGEVEHEDDSELVDVLAGHLLPHGRGDEGLVATLRWAIQDPVGRRVGGEGEGGEGIHYQVDPKELNGSENGLHLVVVHGCDKSKDDSRDVDGDLKLCGSVDATRDESEMLELTCRNFCTASFTARPHLRAVMMEAKLSFIKMIDEASLATSVPEMPMEKPMFEAFRAGASFVPSPVTATISPIALRRVTRILLSSGEERARTWSLGRTLSISLRTTCGTLVLP